MSLLFLTITLTIIDYILIIETCVNMYKHVQTSQIRQK